MPETMVSTARVATHFMECDACKQIAIGKGDTYYRFGNLVICEDCAPTQPD